MVIRMSWRDRGYTHELAEHCCAAVAAGKPSQRAQILVDHHNVAQPPRLYAAGPPNTPSSQGLRIPGMDHNIDHVLKTAYGLLWRQMSKPDRLICRQRVAAA